MAVRVGGIRLDIQVVAGSSAQALKATQKLLCEIVDKTKKQGDESDELRKKLGKLGKALEALGLAIVAERFGSLIRSSTLLAGRVEALGTVLDNVGQIAGLNVQQIGLLEDRVKALGITTQAARQSLTQLAQANLDLQQSARLARIAHDAAVIAGVDSSEAFNRLVVSIQRNDVRLLRNLGIVINLNTVYQRFAQQTGRTVNTLTAFEKRNILLNEVLQRGNLIAGTYEAALGDVFKRFTSLNRKVEEAQRVFGEQFLPAFTTVVDTTDDFLEAFVNTESVLPRVASGVATFTVSLLAAAAAAKAFAFANENLSKSLLRSPLFLIPAALAGIATVLQQRAEGVRAFTAETIRLSEETARQEQIITDTQQALLRLRDIQRDLETTTEDTAAAQAKLNATLDQLIQLQGDARLRLALERNREDLEAFQQLILAGDPDVARTAQERLDAALSRRNTAIVKAQVAVTEAIVDAEQDRIEASRVVERALIEQIAQLELLRATGLDVAESLDQRRQQLRELSAEQERASRAQDEATTRARAEVASLVDLGLSLRELPPDIAELVSANQALVREFDLAAAAVRGLEESFVSLEQADLQQRFDATINAATQARSILQQLETSRRQQFRESNIRFLDEFVTAQAKFQAAAVTTQEEINRLAELNFRRRLAQSNAALARELNSAEGNAEKIAEVEAKFAGQRAALANQRVDDIISGEQALIAIREAQEGILERLQDRLSEIVDRNRELRREIAAEDVGIDTSIIRLQRQIIELQQQRNKENERFNEILDETTDRVARLRQAQVGATAAERAAQQAEIARLQQTAGRTLAIQSATVAQRALEEEQLTNKLIRERERLVEESIEQEEKLIRQVREIRGESADETLQGIDRQLRALRRASEATETFIGRTADRVNNSLVPGLGKVTDAVGDFQNALAGATTSQQIERLQRLFPQTLAIPLQEARNELERIEERIQRFQDRRRGRLERIRVENERRFAELVQSGVSAQRAQLIASRESAEARQQLREEEEELQREREQQTDGIRRLETEIRTAQTAFKELAIEAQTETGKLLELEERRAMLADQRVQSLEREVNALRARREVLRAQEPTGQRALQTVEAFRAGEPLAEQLQRREAREAQPRGTTEGFSRLNRRQVNELTDTLTSSRETVVAFLQEQGQFNQEILETLSEDFLTPIQQVAVNLREEARRGSQAFTQLRILRSGR